MLRSENQQLEIDLAGKDHAGIPTPHTKVALRNHNAPEHLQLAYNTSEKKSILRPSTQEDIRNARRYLERQNRYRNGKKFFGRSGYWLEL